MRKVRQKLREAKVNQLLTPSATPLSQSDLSALAFQGNPRDDPVRLRRSEHQVSRAERRQVPVRDSLQVPARKLPRLVSPTPGNLTMLGEPLAAEREEARVTEKRNRLAAEEASMGSTADSN